ncbi:MAG: hypothetical protein Q8R55_01565 [Candidatus Taylorbacteria bacterium]|nr:hypothetical protein [Candidatus Taylorbacteria bacterium]
MITIITTIIVSILLGIVSPVVSPGVNFLSGNLFSQITSQLPTKSLPVVSPPNLSEVNPMESLINATAPLNSIWKALGEKLNMQGLDSIKTFLNGQWIRQAHHKTVGSVNSLQGGRALKSSLGSGLGGQDTSTIWQVLGIAKSAFILIANILVAVLEIAVWLLRGTLGLMS